LDHIDQSFLPLNILPIGIAIITFEHRFLFTNQALSDSLGYSQSEFLTEISLDNLFRTMVPIEVEHGIQQDLTATLYFEIEIIKKNGIESPYGLTIVPFQSEIFRDRVNPAFRLLIFHDLLAMANSRRYGYTEIAEYTRSKLGLIFYSLKSIGPDPVFIINIEQNFRNYQQLTVKIGVYLMTAIGQGRNYQLGFYGPLPVPDSDFNCLVYSLELIDHTQTDPRAKGMRYCMLVLLFPRVLENFLGDRRRIRSFCNEFFRNIKNISDINYEKLENLRYSIIKLDEELWLPVATVKERQLESKLKEIHQLGRNLSKITGLRESFEQIANFCEKTLDFKTFAAFRVSRVDDGLKVLVARDYKNLHSADDYFLPFHLNNSVIVRAATTGELINIGDIRTIDYYHNFETTNTISELCVPIKFEKEVLGILNVESEIPNAFSKDDEVLLLIVAEQAAAILRRYHLQLQMMTLHFLVENLSKIHDLKESFEQIAIFAEKLLNFKIFCALKAEDGELKFLCHRGYGWTKPEEFPKIPIYSKDFFVSHVAATKVPLFVHDLEGTPDIPFFRVNPDVHAEYAIPLLDGDTLLGILNVESAQPFNSDELFLFDVLAHHATLLLRLYSGQRVDRN
jgi:putative methionine-R-sulfoxide reductase with GAF domain